MKSVLTALLLSISLIFSSGMNSYAQDYEQAAKWMRKAAEQGNMKAQYSLALMYEDGKGVVQDYKEAGKWYLKAAEQGDGDAHVNLGAMYALAQGVVQDYVYAHMWFNIAAANGEINAAEMMGAVAERMTSSQIAEAQKLARECVAKEYKGC